MSLRQRSFDAFREFYGWNNLFAENRIRRLVNKFESNATVTDAVAPLRQRNASSETTMSLLLMKVFMRNPTWSIVRWSHELGCF